MEARLALTILMWFCAVGGREYSESLLEFQCWPVLSSLHREMKPIIATAARLACGLSVVSPCKDARLSQQMIDYIESGQRNPTLSTLLRLANALDIESWKLVKMPRQESNQRESA